jgi:hypothetical protein
MTVEFRMDAMCLYVFFDEKCAYMFESGAFLFIQTIDSS